MSDFFRVLADPKATTRWYLKSPITSSGQQVDPRIFTSGKKYDGDLELKLPLRRKGRAVDFNFCDSDMIVTSSHLNDELQELTGSAIQRIPVDIEMDQESYEILNILDTVRCVDDKRSEFIRWLPQDGRPDKVGQYRMVTRIVIDPEKTDKHKIFRLHEWKIALIVSEDVKDMLEEKKVTGMVFQAVS